MNSTAAKQYSKNSNLYK